MKCGGEGLINDEAPQARVLAGHISQTLACLDEYEVGLRVKYFPLVLIVGRW